MKIKPHGYQMHVVIDEKWGTQSQSGLELVENKNVLICRVESIGEDVTLFKKDDNIMITCIAGEGIEFPGSGIDGKTNKIISEKNVLCAFREGDKMEIIPKEKKIFAEVEPVEECKLESGLLLPARHREPVRIGTIKAIGEKVNKERYKIGGKIAVKYNAGFDLVFPHMGIVQDTHRILNQEDVLCSIEED
jgi:co-chaperonin GroES (HSP10)